MLYNFDKNLTVDPPIFKLFTINMENLEKWRVSEEDFIPIKKTNGKYKFITKRGGFARIYLCTQQSTGRKCVKKESFGNLSNEETRKQFNREVEIYSKYKHPAIIPFIGFCEDEAGLIFLELAENGSLSDVIDRNNKEGGKILDPTSKLIISYGVAAALEYLHSHNVFHRDLKDLNILINDKLQPFLTDFGLSKEIKDGMTIYNSIAETTISFMPPELYEDPEKAHPGLIDVYSYGITLYRLITGIFPFKNKALFQIGNDVKNGIRPDIPEGTPDSYQDLIKQCWDQKPNQRPTFTEICNRLESELFCNDSIDKERFDAYKKIIKPVRPTPSSSAVQTAPVPKLEPPKPEKLEKHKSSPSSNEDHEEVKISPQPPEPKKEELSPLDKLIVEASYNYRTRLLLADALFNGVFGPPDYKAAEGHYLAVANNLKIPEIVGNGEYGYAQCLIKQGLYNDAYIFLKQRSFAHQKPEAFFLVAEMIVNHQIEFTEKFTIFQLYETAAKSGHAEAIIRYTSLLLEQKGERYLKQANKFLKLGSDGGIPIIMYRWSLQLENGRGVGKDINQAMLLMKQAAEFGCAEAQFDYGMHLLKGISFAKDIKVSFNDTLHYFKAAASSGHSKAMLWYSSMQLDIPPDSKNSDKKAAEEFLEKLVDDGTEIDAYVILGQLLYSDGKIEKAIEVLKKGVDKGSSAAMDKLGIIYEELEDECIRKSAICCHSKCGNQSNELVKSKVYYCCDCNKDICKACSKHCHKGHNIEYKNESNEFVCSCNGSS